MRARGPVAVVAVCPNTPNHVQTTPTHRTPTHARAPRPRSARASRPCPSTRGTRAFVHRRARERARAVPVPPAMGCAPSSTTPKDGVDGIIVGIDGDGIDDDGVDATTTVRGVRVTFVADDDAARVTAEDDANGDGVVGRRLDAENGWARRGRAAGGRGAAVHRTGSGRLVRSGSSGSSGAQGGARASAARAGSDGRLGGEGLALTTSGTVLRSPTRTTSGGDWSVHRGQAFGDAVVGAGRLDRGDVVDGRKAGRLSSDARRSAGGGASGRAEEDQTPTKAAAAFTGARANAPASPPPPRSGAHSYAQKRAWHKRTMSEDPNSTPSAFGRWALGSSKSRGGPRRSETTVYKDGGVEHHAGGDVAGAGTHRSAHGGGIQDVIQAMRERQNFVRQLTVETIRLCRPMCELEPSIDALMRLKALDREAAARVQTRHDADTFDGKLRRANSSTSASPNGAVAKTGLATIGRVEMSLDDVEAELVSVQRLIQ